MSNALDLTHEQVEMFAAGLYQLAASDGIDEREMAIIREFCEDAGAPELIDRLDRLIFDPATAYQVLESSWLHKIFLSAALLVVRADGVVTEAEREMLGWMAMALGVDGGFEAVENAVQGERLG